MEFFERVTTDLFGGGEEPARDVTVVENKLKCHKVSDCTESCTTPVFVTGRIVPVPTRTGAGALTSPLQGLQSAHYHVICEEQVQDDAGNNTSDWVPQWEETQTFDFLLMDEAGQSIYVLPTFAADCVRVHGKTECVSTQYTFWPSKIPEAIATLNDRYGYKVRRVVRTGTTY